MRFVILLVLSVMLLAIPLQAQEVPLADQAYKVLKERCYRCHGGASQNAKLNVLSLESLTEARGQGAEKAYFLVPGKPESSGMWSVVEGEDSYMPLAGSPESKAITKEERDILSRWIAAGANFPQRREVKPVTEQDVLAAVREHLLNSKADDRRYLRYFTFGNLQNNPGLTEFDLRLYKAALAKMVNSLSWERSLVKLETIPGAAESVLVLDLRKVGWDKRNLWLRVLEAYPYGLKFDYVKDEKTQQLAKDVSQFSGGGLDTGLPPYVRADWFIVNAAQPPLYHQLLEIPEQQADLEHRLGVNFMDNYLHDKLQRAGFAKSGVSAQNRLIERHESANTPYWWISYDFKPRNGQGDLVRFPLGPKFPQNPHAKQAFDHDGGEIIFSLPNGLQAYMLVDAKGNRINSGPIEVVFDRAAILGSPSIFNGISCMNCHRHGMISEFRDEIRNSDALSGEVRKKVQQLYPPADDLQKLVERDKARFITALEKTIGSYLKVAEDQTKAIESFPEPVGRAAEMYSRDLTVQEAALELGFADVKTFQTTIQANRELLKLGLGTFTQAVPGTIKREKWESRSGTSLFQDIAAELRLGTPVVPGGQ